MKNCRAVFCKLHQDIQESFQNSDPLPWPPMSSDLDSNSLQEITPKPLYYEVLHVLAAGNLAAASSTSESTQRIIFFIAQVSL